MLRLALVEGLVVWGQSGHGTGPGRVMARCVTVVLVICEDPSGLHGLVFDMRLRLMCRACGREGTLVIGGLN